MVFLSKFNLPGKGDEYYSYYPFRFLDDKGLESIEFSDVTIPFFSIRMNFNLNCHGCQHLRKSTMQKVGLLRC